LQTASRSVKSEERVLGSRVHSKDAEKSKVSISQFSFQTSQVQLFALIPCLR